MELFGSDINTNHRRLDILFLPCDMKQITPENKHLADKECLVDLKNETAVKEKKEA